MQKTLYYPLDDLGDILCHFIFYFHDILAVLNSSYLPEDIIYFILKLLSQFFKLASNS